MNLSLILPAALFATIVVYVLLIGGYRGSVKTLKGHSILAPLLVWLCFSTVATSLYATAVDFIPIFVLLKMLGVGYFLQENSDAKSKKSFILILIALSITVVVSLFMNNKIHSVQLLSSVALVSCLILLSWNEILYRSCEDEQPKAKSVYFATGIILVGDFIWLSDALIDGVFSNNMIYVMGLISLLMLPLILRGLLAIQKSAVTVSLSRSALFHGSILMLCGVYLLIVGLTTGLLQTFGFQIRSTNDILIIAVLMTPLSVVFVSTRLRRLVRVKISKHLFNEQFDYRKVWLETSSILHQHATSSVKDAFGGLLSVLHHKKGAYGLFKNGRMRIIATNTAIQPSFTEGVKNIIPFLQGSGWVVDADEAKFNPTQYPELVTSSVDLIGFRWVVPVLEKNNLVGVLFLDENEQGDEPWIMNWELKDFLLTISQQWHWHVLAKMNAEELSQNNQLATFSQMSAFVLHDLKNIDAQLGMILSNKQKFGNDPEFIQDSFNVVSNTHARLSKVLTQLSSKQFSDTHLGRQKTSVQTILSELRGLPEWGYVKKCLSPALNDIDLDVPHDKLIHICSHLLRNAIEACLQAKRAPDITVSCIHDGDDVIIKIADNGCGMSPQFIEEKLFRPLQTTKGNSGMGLGVFDAFQFAHKYGGDLTVESSLGVGTCFSLILPKGFVHNAN